MHQSNCLLCHNFLDTLLLIVWLKGPTSRLGACLPNMIGSLEMKGTDSIAIFHRHVGTHVNYHEGEDMTVCSTGEGGAG